MDLKIFDEFGSDKITAFSEPSSYARKIYKNFEQ